VVAHEAPRQAAQAAEAELFEENFAKSLAFRIAEEDLARGGAGDDVIDIGLSGLAKEKATGLTHGGASPITNRA